MRGDTNSALQRFPRYYQYLNELHSGGVEQVSSRMLGKRLDISGSLVRKDFSRFGEFGQAGYCYNVAELRAHIGHILGTDSRRRTIIVGVEGLGRSLLDSLHFASAGFYVEAAFDSSPDLVGTDVNGIPVLDMSELEPFVRNYGIDTAVLTLSSRAAQRIARRLSYLGIRQFWNVSGMDIVLNECIVEELNLTDSLLALGYQLTRREEEGRTMYQDAG